MARPPGGARRMARGDRRAAPAAAGGGVALRKGTWLPEEDAVLREHVRVHGPREWSSIRSKGLLPRSGKSCRLRWVNKLRPNLKSGCKFSAEEEKLVLDLQAEFGNKWAWIATFLTGRTDNDVKNFWSIRQKRLARTMHPPRPARSSGRKLRASKAAASSSASLFAHNISPDQAPFEGNSSNTYGQFRAATPPVDTRNSALFPYDQISFQHLGDGGAFLPALRAQENEASSSNAAPLLARTDNSINNFWGTSQKPSGSLLSTSLLGQPGMKCSSTTAAASSLQPSPAMVKNFFQDQVKFEGSSSSTYSQCRAGTPSMDTSNSMLFPYDQTGFQHLGYGGAFLPALPTLDNEASSSQTAPSLARTDNGVNNFLGASQKPSGSLLHTSILGQARTNCSSMTAAASSFQASSPMNFFQDQVKFEGSSSSTYGQCLAGTLPMGTSNSVLFPYDQTGFQHLGYGGAFLPALPTLDNEASSSHAAPSLARTDNSVNNLGASQKPSGSLLGTSVLSQSRTNCSATTAAASSLLAPPPMVKGLFLESVPFERSSFCSHRHAGTTFEDATGSEQVANEQTAYQLFSLGGAQPPAVRLATDIQASSSNVDSSWPPQLQLYQPLWPPQLNFPWLCSDFAAGFVSAGDMYDFAYHQDLPPFMQSSQIAFPFFGMQHGIKIEPQNPPNHFDDLPLNLFDSAAQLPPTSPLSSRTISDP